jgi:AcrR family transcriptional regulator
MAARPRRRTRLDPEVRRGQIVEAAERVLLDRDPNDVTFEELAAAAGVSRALVYNYFGDKAGLIAAVYVRCLHRLHDELEHAIDPYAPDPVRLKAGIDCYLRFAQRNVGSWRLMRDISATDHPDVRQARRERFEELAAGWGAGVEARIAARGVVAFLEGSTVVWIDSGGHDVDRVVEMLFTILWHGLSAVDRSQARPAGESSTRQQYHAATLR